MQFLNDHPEIIEWGYWLLTAVLIPAFMGSGWYARQSFLKRKVIQLIIKNVKEMEPEVTKAKAATVSGKLPYEVGEAIKKEVIFATHSDVTFDHPELAKAISKLDVSKEIEKAVVKVRKKRKIDPNKPGGAGAHP